MRQAQNEISPDGRDDKETLVNNARRQLIQLTLRFAHGGLETSLVPNVR